jgi:hypothetical protein
MRRLPFGRIGRAACLAGAMAVAAALAWPGAAVASSTDHPSSAITAPTAGSILPLERPMIIAGTAANGEQGGILLVEVSINGGDWQPAQGTETWQYVFTANEPGPVTIRSRASTADVVEDAPRSLTVNAGDGTPPEVSCPCTFWPPTLPGRPVLDEQDAEPIEVGLRFRTDRDGYVTGMYFYRNAANTGPQVAHMWSADGKLLAEATLTGSADPVPRIAFNPPVPVQAGAGYVVSYYTPTGHYASSIDYFSGAVVRAPFEAIYDENGTAGVYRYGGGFPDETWEASNYWLIPIFATS